MGARAHGTGRRNPSRVPPWGLGRNWTRHHERHLCSGQQLDSHAPLTSIGAIDVVQ
jgi:hypothetical protein